MSGDVVTEASAGRVDLVGGVRAGVDALLEAELSGLSDLEVAGLLRELEVQRRRLDAVDVALVAEAQLRSVAHAYGPRSTGYPITAARDSAATTRWAS